MSDESNSGGKRKNGTLYLCATPIGNLEDMTYRAVRVLGEVPLIAAEDTRRTRQLLTHFGLSTRLVSYHEHNKDEKGPRLIAWLEEGNDLFTREMIDLRAQADEAIRELSLKAEEHRTTIENLLPEGMVVNGNGLLIYSIFRNLIENAIEYAGDGCSVGIQCYKPEDGTHYFIHLYDTGKGVQNEYLPRLFDRFLRIEEGRSRKNGGTGLGLSIVKHAVLFHGGDIYVKNRDGGGLEFFFSIKKSESKN